MLIPLAVFKSGISRVCDREASRYALGAVHLRRNGQCSAEACDGRRAVRLSWDDTDAIPEYPGSIEHSARSDFRALVPAPDWEEAGKLGDKVSKSRVPVLRNVAVTEGVATVTLGTTDGDKVRTLTVRPPEGKFPDLDEVIPKYDIVTKEDFKPENYTTPEAAYAVQGFAAKAIKVRLNASFLAECSKIVRTAADTEFDGVDLLIPIEYGRPVLIESQGSEVRAQCVLMPFNTE